MTRRPTARGAQRGLTLIELMVGVSIMALVGLLAAPSFSSVFARGAVRGAADEARADLQFARSESVQRNAAVTVSYSSTGYTITRGADTLKTVTFGGGAVLASGSTMSVVFDPVRATATVTNGPAVFAHARTAGTVRVAVNVLGRVELCSPSAAMPGVPAC